MEIKGSSLNNNGADFKDQGYKINVHGMANFYGQCMDLTFIDKTPVGVLNKVWTWLHTIPSSKYQRNVGEDSNQYQA